MLYSLREPLSHPGIFAASEHNNIPLTRIRFSVSKSSNSHNHIQAYLSFSRRLSTTIMTILAFGVIVGVILAVAVGVFLAMRHNTKSKDSKRQVRQELHELPLYRPFKRGYTLRDPSRADPVRPTPGQPHVPANATHATLTTDAPSASSPPTSSPFPPSTAMNLANALQEFYQPSKRDSVGFILLFSLSEPKGRAVLRLCRHLSFLHQLIVGGMLRGATDINR